MKVRLPEELCGATYDAITVGDLAHIDVPGVGRVVLPVASLTEVKPELPPEPPFGSIVLVDPGWMIDPPSVAFRRYASGWTEPGRDADAEGFEYYDWAKVCSYGAPVLLVPAPEPVTLPWELQQGTRLVQVRRDDMADALPGAAFLLLGDADEGEVEMWLTSAVRLRLIAALTAAEAQATP